MAYFSKLSGGGNKSGKLEDLFHLLQTLGIEISHINLQKVRENLIKKN